MTSTVVDTAVPVNDPAGEPVGAHLDDGGGADDLAAARPASRRQPGLFAARRRPGMRLPATGPTPDRPVRMRIVEQTNDGPAELWLYDAIGEDFFGFGINAEQMCRDIADLAADEILLRVNSPGGDYFDGIAIYNAIVQHPAQVVAQVDGLAASAASFIIQAANEVIVGRGARIMIHDAIGYCVGNAADMLDMNETLDGISADIADVYHAHAGGGAKAWRDRMQAETWFSADQSVAAGLADTVMPAPKKRGQEQAAAAAVDWSVASSWDLSSVFRYPDRESQVAAAAVPSAPEPAPAPVRERIVASAVTSTDQGTVGIVSEAGPELDHPPTGTVVEQAPADTPGRTDDAAPDVPPEPTAAEAEPVAEPDEPVVSEPVVPAPEPQPEPVAASAGTFPAGRAVAVLEPVAPSAEPGPVLDPWAALTEHLTNPRPATVDQLLAALRGDTT